MRTALKWVLWIGGPIAVIVIILYAFVVDTWTVPTDDPRLTASLEPNVHAGDLILIARGKGTSPGHLTRCALPEGEGFAVGRVGGVYGDTITVAGDKVKVQGRVGNSSRSCDISTVNVKNPANGEDTTLHCSIDELGRDTRVLVNREFRQPDVTATVENGKVYLVSDDRHFHYDSRDYGQVDPNTCQDLYLRLWSAEGWMDSANRMTVLW